MGDTDTEDVRAQRADTKLLEDKYYRGCFLTHSVYQITPVSVVVIYLKY